jgi:large subunit ribosomal protein L20
MPRVKGGNVARKRRRKILKLAKGYYGSKSLLYKTAHEQVMKSLAYAYRDRKQRKREFRKLWIARINAAARLNGMSYSRLIDGLTKAGVEINRKMLADIAVNDAQGFTQITEIAKQGLAGKVTPNAKPETAPVKKEAAPKKETAPKKEAPAKQAEFTQEQLEDMTVADLKELCKDRDITGYSALKKAELVELLLK